MVSISPPIAALLGSGTQRVRVETNGPGLLDECSFESAAESFVEKLTNTSSGRRAKLYTKLHKNSFKKWTGSRKLAQTMLSMAGPRVTHTFVMPRTGSYDASSAGDKDC